MWDLIVLISDHCHSKEGPLYFSPGKRSIGVHTLSFSLFKKDLICTFFFYFFKFLTSK